MNNVMDTLAGLFLIALLCLMAGCATELTGQRGHIPGQTPSGRSDIPTVAPQESTQPPSEVVVQPSEPPRIDKTKTPVPVVTKHAIANQVAPNQTTEGAGKNPQQAAAAAVVAPNDKSSPQETRIPQPAPRWSRQLTVSQERFLERNENSLLRVYVDMSKAEVMSIMSDYRAGDWVNPCKHEKLMDNNGKVYDVIFYLSRRPEQSRPFNERLMTPVILRDDRVYAIGRYSLKKLRATSHLVNSSSIGCQHV